MDNLSKFGERLSELMFDQNVSSKQLSEAVKVNVTTVCRWKRGTIKIFLSNLIKLAEYLNCSIEFLVGRTEKVIDFIPKACQPFYERLRAVMEEKHISRYRIVKDTRIGDDYFTTWKKGSDPHVLCLIELTQYLNCTIDYLIGRE